MSSIVILAPRISHNTPWNLKVPAKLYAMRLKYHAIDTRVQLEAKGCMEIDESYKNLFQHHLQSIYKTLLTKDLNWLYKDFIDLFVFEGKK